MQTVQLTNEEKLTLENLHLKNRLLYIQQQQIKTEEINMLNTISSRSGKNIDGWIINLETGTVSEPNKADNKETK